MGKLFHTKVCGIRTSVDLRDAIECDVEAIGLNFVPESPRYISPNEAGELWQDTVCSEKVSKLALANTKLVGIFVNPTPDYVRQVLGTISLHYIQLHGEEIADDWRSFDDAPLIKAVRWNGSLEQNAMLLRWHQILGDRLAAFLVDAPSTVLRGGSGKKADWNSLVPRPVALAGKPLILAGGLTPENVALAIQIVAPAAVDTASGVESEPAKKDKTKMQSFVLHAKNAWKNLRLK